jgi:inorganic pyrophosphatase
METYKNLEGNVKNLKQAIADESKLRAEQESSQRDLATKLVALQNKNDISFSTIEDLEDANRKLEIELKAKNSQLEGYKRIEKEIQNIKNGLVTEIENRKRYEEANRILEIEVNELKQVRFHNFIF